MKNLKFIIISIVIVIAIVIGVIIIKPNNIDVESEKENLKSYLDDISYALGITGLADHYDGNFFYQTDLFKDYSLRQLFTMEYILHDTNNYDKFIVLNTTSLEKDDNLSPVENETLAYLDYETFNEIYKKLFGEDYDVGKREISYARVATYDIGGKYVYYRNTRTDGMYVENYEIKDIKFDKKESLYTATLDVNYSDDVQKILGNTKQQAKIQYHKVSDNIVLDSYMLMKK